MWTYCTYKINLLPSINGSKCGAVYLEEAVNASKKKGIDENDSEGEIDLNDSFVVPDDDEGNYIHGHRQLNQKRGKKRAKEDPRAASKIVGSLKKKKFIILRDYQVID